MHCKLQLYGAAVHCYTCNMWSVISAMSSIS